MGIIYMYIYNGRVFLHKFIGSTSPSFQGMTTAFPQPWCSESPPLLKSWPTNAEKTTCGTSSVLFFGKDSWHVLGAISTSLGFVFV